MVVEAGLQWLAGARQGRPHRSLCRLSVHGQGRWVVRVVMVALSVMDRVSTVGLVWLIGDRFLGVVMVYAPMNCGACFIQVPGCDGSNAISGIDADELLVMYWPWAGSSEQWSWGGQCDADHTMCAMLILGSVMLTTLCLQWSWG